MEFLAITADDFRLEEIYRSYAFTFSEDERRSEHQFRQLFQHPKAKIISLLHDATFVGYIILWELTEFVFVEHLEIFPEFQNHQHGTAVLKLLYQKYSKIILESEPETLDENAKRRIRFYTKNGLQIIDKDYLQPAYDQQKKSVPLWLLGNFPPENPLLLKEEIYDVVYS